MLLYKLNFNIIITFCIIGGILKKHYDWKMKTIDFIKLKK